MILAEDTRTSGILLKHLGIEKKLISYHAHNEHKTLDHILDLISGSKSVALVSDAGTPGISDPGFLLVRECIRRGIEVECLPGPTALVPALVASGLPCDSFVFIGFLPVKKGRQSALKELQKETRTLVLYESPFRLVKTLGELADVFGAERKASVSREMTKIYEETKRGTLPELKEYFSSMEVKGEIVLVVEGLRGKQAPST